MEENDQTLPILGFDHKTYQPPNLIGVEIIFLNSACTSTSYNFTFTWYRTSNRETCFLKLFFMHRLDYLMKSRNLACNYETVESVRICLYPKL